MSNNIDSAADMVVYNGKVTTNNRAQPDASAFAVKNGRFYAVGTDEEITALSGPGTVSIDAHGQRVIPGLNDAHIHVNMEGVKYNYSLRWDGVPTLRRALEMLTEQAGRTPEGQWVKVIGGWSPYQFAERRLPTMEELREAVKDRPFIVQYAYNHAFLNDAAMRQIGVGGPGFPDIPDTLWEKDGAGNFTGHVYGDPAPLMFWIIESMVPQPTFEESKNSLQQLIAELNRSGLTSVIDAGGAVGYPEGHEAIRALVDDGLVNIRFSFMDIGDATKGIPEVDEEIRSITVERPISPGQSLSKYMYKGYKYEGVGETLELALLDYENFDRPPHIVDTDVMHQSILRDVAELVRRRLPFRIHCTYDENISNILDSLEKVNGQTPFDGLRWAIEHAEFISDRNISRIKALGGGVTVQDKMAFHGDGFVEQYGTQKALGTPPLRALVDSGLPVALGTDGLRVTSFNPWVSISWATTGKSVSGSQVLADSNRLTREEALLLYTLGSAWFQYDEHEKGRIAPGNLADFAVIDQDYFSVNDDEIAGISSDLTVVDGRVVHAANNFADLAPEPVPVLPAWSPVNHYGGYYRG